MTPEQQKMVDSKLYTRQPAGEPPVRSSEFVGQQRLEALIEAERVLDVMHAFYRHRGPWETMHGTDVLERVRRAIALSNEKLTDPAAKPEKIL